METAKTHVYFNLHKHVWSVMLRGIVQRHATNVCIKDVDFVVRAAGHRKVLEQKRKTFMPSVEAPTLPSGSV